MEQHTDLELSRDGFGKLVERVLEELGLDYRDLAEDFGITGPTVLRYIEGKALPRVNALSYLTLRMENMLSEHRQKLSPDIGSTVLRQTVE